jgi:arginine-tRNA-protein transferase
VANNRAFLAERIDPEIYHAFMDAGFRRSGGWCISRRARRVGNACPSACRGHVPAEQVPATVLRRNDDLSLEVTPAKPSEEKFDLYRRYVLERHRTEERPEEPDRESFVSFLYDSPVDTLEFAYRDAAGKLLAVGICDASRLSLSSVYFYFDPSSPSEAWELWRPAGNRVRAGGGNPVLLPWVLDRALPFDAVQS